MNPRVAEIFPLPLGQEDGASRRVLLAIEALKELDYDVTIFTVKEGKKFTEGLRLVGLDRHIVEYNRAIFKELMVELSLIRKYFRRIFTVVLREKYDIVEIHGVTRAVPQLAALVAARIAGTKIIYNYHDLLPEEGTLIRGVSENSLLYKLLLILEKVIFRWSNTIVVVSDVMKDILLRRYGEKLKHRIYVTYPYVNLGESVTSISRKHLAASYGIPQGKPIIIYIGRMDPVIRGLENLLTAFRKLVKERGIDAYLLLVGEGIIRAELGKMATEQGIKNRVIFPGSVSHEVALELVDEANVAVIAYPETIGTHIALPTKIVEYMAAGKIIVTSRLAQISKILKGDAIYCDPKNVDSFADALEKAVMRIDQADKVKQRLQQKARLFDKNRVKETVKEVYRKVVLQQK